MTRRASKIEVELFGGLGNQLFGYFAGKYLAQENKAILILRFKRPHPAETIHVGSISELNLDGMFLQDNRSGIYRFFDRITNRMSRTSPTFARINCWLRRIYYSDTLGFDSNIAGLKSPIKISGYFQTWK